MENYVTLKEAADILNVHVNTLRNWANSGKISCCRSPGQHRKFSLSALQKVYIEKSKDIEEKVKDPNELDIFYTGENTYVDILYSIYLKANEATDEEYSALNSSPEYLKVYEKFPISWNAANLRDVGDTITLGLKAFGHEFICKNRDEETIKSIEKLEFYLHNYFDLILTDFSLTDEAKGFLFTQLMKFYQEMIGEQSYEEAKKFFSFAFTENHKECGVFRHIELFIVNVSSYYKKEDNLHDYRNILGSIQILKNSFANKDKKDSKLPNFCKNELQQCTMITDKGYRNIISVNSGIMKKKIRSYIEDKIKKEDLRKAGDIIAWIFKNSDNLAKEFESKLKTDNYVMRDRQKEFLVDEIIEKIKQQADSIANEFHSNVAYKERIDLARTKVLQEAEKRRSWDTMEIKRPSNKIENERRSASSLLSEISTILQLQHIDDETKVNIISKMFTVVG